MKVEKIDHIHLYVEDLEKAREFFSSILGTKFSRIMDVKEYDVQSVIAPLGIELVSARSKGSEMEKILQKKGEGVYAISLKVPDIDEAITELKEKGLRMIGSSHFGRLKEAWFYPQEAYGVMIELCEYETVHPGEIAFRDIDL